MSALQPLLQSLYQSPAAAALRESEDMYPLVETLHVLTIGLVAGTIVAVDLRVLGWLLPGRPLRPLLRAVLPLTWWGFALMALTGFSLFAADAVNLYANPAFRVKLLLLGLAAINALLFHRTLHFDVAHLEDDVPATARTRTFALTSILLWCGVIVSGRFIAFFHAH